MIKKLAAGLLVALGLVAVLAYPTIQRHTDLNETLTWIEQTYNPHENASILSQGHGWERHYVRRGTIEELTEEFQTTFSAKGNCSVGIHSETSPVGVFVDVPSKTNYTFNLHDIDVDSIKIKTFDLHSDVFNCADPEQVNLYNLNCQSAELYFQSRDGAMVINEDTVRTYTKLTGADHESRSVSKTHEAWLIVDDVSYAHRLAKAWKHAAELCGAKPSKF